MSLIVVDIKSNFYYKTTKKRSIVVPVIAGTAAHFVCYPVGGDLCALDDDVNALLARPGLDLVDKLSLEAPDKLVRIVLHQGDQLVYGVAGENQQFSEFLHDDGNQHVASDMLLSH